MKGKTTKLTHVYVLYKWAS